MSCVVKRIKGHFEAFTPTGQFIFSSDNQDEVEQEAREEGYCVKYEY